jgi:hypothetical protein
MAITETDLKFTATAAIIGFRGRPKVANSTPAASGTPMEL